jgi:hypothetical protein
MSGSKSIETELGSADWQSFAIELKSKIHDEIFYPKGLIASIKGQQDAKKQGELSARLASVQFDGDYDRYADGLATAYNAVHQKYDASLNFDFINEFNGYGDLGDYPLVEELVRIAGDSENLSVRQRATGILAERVAMSMTQGRKSQAGNAGEFIVEQLLLKAGLKKGEHYRTQYKSKAGSDTDFVFPCIKDFNDQGMEAALAVQFSTNDRIRLVESELKAGVKPYTFTGNGLQVSSKTLKDIGDQNIQNAQKKNHTMVAYGPEIALEIARCEGLKKPKYKRAKFFKEQAISMTEFCEKMRERFG